MVLLLCSTGLFVLLGIGAFVLAHQEFRRNSAPEEQESDSKFARFAPEVRDGKRVLTTEQWLEAMRTERRGTTLERSFSLGSATALRALGWLTIMGAAIQVALAFSVEPRKQKHAAEHHTRANNP